VLSDIRRGLRSLVANPSFVVLGVSCLGIGIGASAMTFTAVNHALLRPLGSVSPEGLVAVAEVHRTGPNQWWPVSAPNLQDWQAAVGERARLAPLRASSFVIGTTTADTRVEGAYATDDLFAVLGVSPVLGRGLQPQDELAGSGLVVVLSESYWRRQLNGDRAVIGRTLTLDGTPHVVVGVVPSLLAIGLPGEISSARMWVPLRTAAAAAARDDRSLFVVARLAADVGIESFTAQLEAVAGELSAVHPENDGWGVGVEALPFSAVGLTRPLLLFSLGAAALVLLVACANVANLTLANAGRRRHEFAVRAALGASSARLVAQLLSETLTVAALGAVAGLLLARFGLQFLVRLVETNTLAPAELPIDAVSFAYTLALTFATTALVGLLPALEVARHGARAQIAESGSGLTTAPGQSRLRSALVVGQVAASLVLLIGAVLLSRSLVNLLALDGGVATQSVTSVRVEALQQTASPDDVERYVARVLDALSGIAGVESAAASANFLPLRGGGLRSSVSVPGGGGTGPTSAYTGITPGFFDALDIPLLRGRTFGENEQRGRVAVVNQRLADLLWPNQDALGREFRLDADPQRGWITVIGVAGDVLTFDSSGPTPLPMAFLDARSFDRYPMFFFVRTADAAQIVGPAVINSAIASLEIPLRRVVVTPMAQVARDPFWRQQVLSTWFSAFGTAALALAAIGVYGVLAYLVGQRRREIGIRMAVGARRGQVLALVLRQGAILAVAGIAVGLVGAFAVARALQSMLFGVDALEWPVFAAVAAVLAAIAIVASLAPALRASRVDPNVLFKG
jgi:putative ABC transport system permease protein